MVCRVSCCECADVMMGEIIDELGNKFRKWKEAFTCIDLKANPVKITIVQWSYWIEFTGWLF